MGIVVLQDDATEPSIFLDDDVQNATAQEAQGEFYLNEPPKTDSEDNRQQDMEDAAEKMEDATHNNDHDAHNNADENAATLAVEEPDEDVSSQPIVPFVRMLFDNVDEAQRVYNNYAMKMGLALAL